MSCENRGASALAFLENAPKCLITLQFLYSAGERGVTSPDSLIPHSGWQSAEHTGEL